MKRERKAIWRRWFMRIAVCLLIGVVVNVGVAWCAALLSPMHLSHWNQNQGEGAPRPDWAEGAESSPWKGWHVLRVGPGVRRWAGRWGHLTERAAKIGSRAFDRAAWPTTQYLSEENGTVLTTVSGWPALAMKHERWVVESEIDEDHIVEVGIVRSGLVVGKRAVPLNPIWTGFVINSLFYAALAFVPFIGESSARLRSVVVEAAALVRSNRRALRRWLVRVPFAIGLAMILNVLVAWGCATWSPIKVVTDPTGAWQEDVDRPYWARGRGWDRSMGSAERGFGVLSWFGSWGDDDWMAAGAPGKGDRPTAETESRGEGYVATVASGFPMYAMRCEEWNIAVNSRSYRPVKVSLLKSGIDIGPRHQSMLDRRSIPLAPIWRGFLINTLIYSGVMLIVPLTHIPRSVRGAIRAHRGQCPKCNYDLRGLPDGAPCPECGRAVPTTTR